MTDESAMLTRRQVADILSVSERTVSALISDGELRAVMVHGAYRVRREWLTTYIDGNTTP